MRQIDIETGYIIFKITKNSKPRVVPISKKLTKLMMKYERVKKQYFIKNDKTHIKEEYYFLSRTGRKLFTSNFGEVNNSCKNLNIPMGKAYPHNFRNTFTVNILKNTKDVYLVSKLLGHCNVSITEELEIFQKIFKH